MALSPHIPLFARKVFRLRSSRVEDARGTSSGTEVNTPTLPLEYLSRKRKRDVPWNNSPNKKRSSVIQSDAIQGKMDEVAQLSYSVSAMTLALTRLTLAGYEGVLAESPSQLHKRLRMAAALEEALYTKEKDALEDRFRATYPPPCDQFDPFVMGGNPSCLRFYESLYSRKRSAPVSTTALIEHHIKQLLEEEPDADDPIEDFSEDNCGSSDGYEDEENIESFDNCIL